MDTCSQGECGVTESACSDSSAGSVYDTCTSYNQAAVDNGDSDACTGTVSTRWTYDGYSYSQGPTSSPDPGSGGGTSDEYGDCSCYCDGSLQGIIPVDDGVTESFCDNNGPGPSQCPNIPGFTCDGGTTTVTWVYNSAYQGTNFGGPPPDYSDDHFGGPPPDYSDDHDYSDHSNDDSGSSGPVGDCECLCGNGDSFNPPVFPNQAGPDAGGVTESECTSQGTVMCKEMWTMMVDNSPNVAPCSSGTVDEVSTVWSP